MRFARPDSLDDALSLLATQEWRILAGGTDFYPALGDRPVTEPVLDITGIPELKAISRVEEGWRIGAGVTWSNLIAEELPEAFEALKSAAREVGSVQIQNRATIAGNICNASPAADGIVPLLVMDAEVELVSTSGTRRLPLSGFVTGNRSTELKPGELLSAIIVPSEGAEGSSSFLKLGSRRYLVISIAMVACRLCANDHGKIERAAIAVGACSAVAQRLSTLEGKLIGRSLSSDFTRVFEPEDWAVLSPIDDVRAPAEYRMDASQQLVARALRFAAEGEMS